MRKRGIPERKTWSCRFPGNQLALLNGQVVRERCWSSAGECWDLNGDLEMDLESRRLSLHGANQRKIFRNRRYRLAVLQILMEKLLELFPTLLLEISAGRYEFGWGSSPNAIIGKGPISTTISSILIAIVVVLFQNCA